MAQCLKNGTVYRKAGIGTLNALFGSIYPEVGQANHVNILCKYSCSIWQKILDYFLFKDFSLLKTWMIIDQKQIIYWDEVITTDCVSIDAKYR